MKSQQEIELALKIMELVDGNPALRNDELMAHKAIIDFAKWCLDKPNIFGEKVFDPHSKLFPLPPPNADSFSA